MMTERRQQSRDDGQPRRQAARVRGPFLGRRRGALTTDITIHDLSVGGCLVESYHQVAPGRRMRLDIDLPENLTITVEAEALYDRTDYGFAVKFVAVPESTRTVLEQVLERLRTDVP
jgi:hypothetical protein